jgi:hypothetical protein
VLKNEIIITPLQIYEVPVLIDRHGEGTIYKISDIHCVKVPSGDNYSIKKMGYEIKISRLLYSLGISVPEPIMCDYVRINGAEIPSEYNNLLIFISYPIFFIE